MVLEIFFQFTIVLERSQGEWCLKYDDKLPAAYGSWQIPSK